MAAQEILKFLRTIEEELIPDWFDAAEVILYEGILTIWPSTDWGENIYATNASLDAWETTEKTGSSLTLTCMSDYAGWADEGHTRYGGKASARPFGKRGGVDYTEQIMDWAAPRIFSDLDDRVGSLNASS